MFAFAENFDFILTQKAPDKELVDIEKKAKSNEIKKSAKLVWQKKGKLLKKVGNFLKVQWKDETETNGDNS